MNLQFAVNNGTPVFDQTGPTIELAFGLQFPTALLSNLDLDLDHYRVALSRDGGEHQRMATTQGLLALRAAFIAHTGNDRRALNSPPQLFANEAGRGKAEQWLRRYILNSALEVGIVGDFQPEEAKTLAASTLGTLSRRRQEKPGTPLSISITWMLVEDSAELPASTSMCCILWPVSLPNDPRSTAALALAADILRDRAMIVLRESLGATYSPDTQVFRDAVQLDFAFVSMVNKFELAQSQKLNVLSLALATDLAAKGATEVEFNRLKEPARTRRAQAMRSSDWWANMVAVAQRRPGVLDEMRQRESVLDAVTLDDVNQAVLVFKPTRFTSVLLHPASAKIEPIKPTAKTRPSKKD